MDYATLGLIYEEEEASRRREVLARLESLSYPILEELGKLIFLNSPQDRKHWIRQINGMGRRLASQTLDGKRLSAEQYLYYLFVSPFCESNEQEDFDAVSFENLKEWICEDEKYVQCPKFDVTVEEMRDPLRTFYNKFSVQLASRQIDVGSLVEELLKNIGM